MKNIKSHIFAITFFKMSLSKHFLKIFLGVYFLLSSICLLYGQQYPVQVNVVVLPPYAMRLGEYATTGEEKMRVQLLMTDLQEPMHQVKLRFTLEAGSNSVVMGGSTPFVSGWNNITLMPGMPVWLSNIDMRALFDYNNLTGISYTQYSKPLPQGIYRYCFQALDAFNNRELSAKSCAMVYLQQYDPPMLNLPQRAEKVMKQGAFQNILFQWMPRQLAPSTKYVFTLKEIWDRSIDPQMAFLTSRTLYEETVLPNMLYFGMDKPWLMPGKRYAWQVKAISANPGLPNSSLPTDEDGVYRNNGLSEIYWFDYEENCNVPQFLIAKITGRGRAEIRWAAPQGTNIGGNTYKLQYRKKDGGVWSEKQTTQEIVNLTDLGDGIDYEYRVGSVCGSSGDEGYVYSGIQLFTLPTKEEQQQQYQCGVMPKIEIGNREPMKGTMAVNEVFTAGDFAVTVLSSEGADGTYSGQGYIQVPYLGDTKLKVVFKDVQINTDKQLIGGMVETTYDPKERNYQFVQEGIGETFGDMGIKVMNIDYAITEIKYDSATKRLTVIGKAGENGETPAEEILPTGRDYQLVDKDGKIWNVDENGNVSEGGEIAKGGTPNSKNTDGISGTGKSVQIEQYKVKNIKLIWEKDASTKYAFDDGGNKPKELQKEYSTTKDAEGKEVLIPYKAVLNGKEDLLNAVIEITDTTLNSAEVIFKTLTGKSIPVIQQYKTPNGRKYTLQLKGAYDYATEEVMAMLVPRDSGSNQQVIGSFKLVHLSPKTVNITLVPLDAQSQQKIQVYKEELQKIYDSIGVTFNIKEEPIMDISSIVQGNEIVSEDAESMNSYSKQQQQINAMYKGQSNDRYVVFITSKRASTGQGGYMRLNGQYGYVYGNAEAKTLAHEIGHGVFRLEHPWSKYKTTKNSSNLLLDYKTGGRELCHMEWKQINDPAFKLYAFQSSSSGQYANEIVIDYDKLIKWLIDNKGKTVDYVFSNFLSKEYNIAASTLGIVKIPIDKKFVAVINGVSKTFNLKGYLSTGTGKVNLNPNDGKIIVGINIVPKDDKIQYTLNYNFTDKNEIAIGLETNESEEMEYLFVQQNIVYPSWYQDKITNQFANAMNKAKTDCDVLDYLYENIPSFVLPKLSDADKWQHLQILSLCNVDAIGTDEYKAIINLLGSVLPNFLKDKADKEPAFLMKLYDRFGSKEKVAFIATATKVLANVWIGTEKLEKVYADACPIGDDGMQAIACFGMPANTLTFGYIPFYNEGDYKSTNCVGQFTLQGGAPVLLSYIANNQVNEIIVPAFIAGQTMLIKKTESLLDFLSQSIGMLMPELLIKPATLNSWGKFLKSNNVAKSIDNVVDEAEMVLLAKEIKYLPGPQLPQKVAETFDNLYYTNRKLLSNERFYKYHGINNRTGKKYAWYTNKKYSTELELRQKLAIREDWGVEIKYITEFDVPSGTWISEGKAASQGVGYPGQDYQAVITNTPDSWIIRTDKAFK